MSKPSHPEQLSIGELSRRTGASLRSIRHYDDHGLLKSARAANGYRCFPDAAVAQVKQIRRLIDAGFSLAEIRSFPDCMRMIEGAAICPETAATHCKRLQAIEQQIDELERQRRRLRAMLEGSAAIAE